MTRGFEVIAAVIGVFFALGIILGVLLVVALPSLNALFRHRNCGREYLDGGGWDEPPELPEDDGKSPWCDR